jgi:sugar lactone lactonase YvrE
MSSRRWIAATAVVAGAAAGGLAAWLWFLRPRDPVLEQDWTARAFVLAGDGKPGTRDGHVTRARFSDPFGVAVAPDGSVFVADAGEAHAVRRISPDGIVSTIATGFNTPSGIAIDASGVLYVADTANNAIRRVARDGTVTTLAQGFNGPIGVAVDRAGRLIVADTYNDRIRAIQTDGTVVDITQEEFDTPCGVAVDAVGNIYIAETGAGAVRMISTTGVVSTVEPIPADGLFRPIGIAVGAAGALYVTDDRGRIVEIKPGVAARTLVGSHSGFADGVGSAALLRGPSGVAVAGEGRLIVVEPRNALVRLVVAQSLAELRPPSSPDINPAFDAERFAREPLLWPLDPLDGPFEITGTLGEPRGGDGERFHAGIDVHGTDGTDVRAIRSGVVRDPISTNAFDTLNESVRIGALTYVHVRVARRRGEAPFDLDRFAAAFDETGKLSNIRVKRGARFTAGETIGSVNAFNHVHLNVGWPAEEHNPLHFRLAQFEDTVPPTIARGGVRLFREDGEVIRQRARGRLMVEGRVRIVVDAWDQVDGNKARRRLGLYRLGYQLLTPEGAAVEGFESPRETILFDRLAPDPDASRVVYATGSGIPFYGRRSTRFLYVVTNTLRSGVASQGVWDTADSPPGDYTLRILAADINGNVAEANRDVPITIQRKID